MNKESGKSVLILSFFFCVLTSSSYIRQNGLEHTLITSFCLSHPFEARVSKHSQSWGVPQGVRPSTYKFQGDTTQSITTKEHRTVKFFYRNLRKTSRVLLHASWGPIPLPWLEKNDALPLATRMKIWLHLGSPLRFQVDVNLGGMQVVP